METNQLAFRLTTMPPTSQKSTQLLSELVGRVLQNFSGSIRYKVISSTGVKRSARHASFRGLEWLPASPSVASATAEVYVGWFPTTLATDLDATPPDPKVRLYTPAVYDDRVVDWVETTPAFYLGDIPAETIFNLQNNKVYGDSPAVVRTINAENVPFIGLQLILTN